MEFGILGPLEVRHNSGHHQLSALKQRILLGMLLCQANRIVSVEALSDALWADAPPRTGRKNLQMYVSGLRKLFGRDPTVRLLHTPPGYTLRLGPDQLDALRFTELTQAGRAAADRGEVAAAGELLDRAVRLWRGAVLPDLASVPKIAEEAQQLGEQYLAAYEDWAEAKLALGQHNQIVTGIDALVRRHPYRERLRHSQLLALYRAGRQTDALARFQEARQLLAREMGLVPSPVLARLHESILRRDRTLESAVRIAAGPTPEVTTAGR